MAPGASRLAADKPHKTLRRRNSQSGQPAGEGARGPGGPGIRDGGREELSGSGLPGQRYLPRVRTGKRHNTALSSSSAFTLSPVLRCVVNPKRLPGEGFKKNKLTAFADKIAKEIGQSSEGQGWGETKVRTLSEASLSCPSS